MLAKCISVSLSASGEGQETESSSQYSQILTAGTSYVVLAMTFWGQRNLLFINPDRGSPAWVPLELFELAEPTVPSGWLAGVLREASEPGIETAASRVVLGYREMATDPSHYGKLLDRDEGAWRAFEHELRNRSALELIRSKLRAVQSGELARTEAASWASDWLDTEGASGFSYPSVIWEVVSDMIGMDAVSADSDDDVRELLDQLR